MENDIPPIKRRKKLHTDQTNNSESNKDLDIISLNESKNSSPNDAKESAVRDLQNDHSALEQEISETTNEVVMEESNISTNTESKMDVDNSSIKLDRNKESGSKNDHIALEQESSERKNEVVMEESKLGMNTESKMDVDNSSTKLDENKKSDNMPLKNSVSCGQNGHLNPKKNLLVLDINGLLVDIVLDPYEGYKSDTYIGPKAVFKRPHCDDFLKFCFEKFNVGVWTSRTRKNIDRVLDFLMKDTRRQLLFCWDQSHCTNTGFNTIDNSDKPLVLKELKKLWEKEDVNLPFDKGVYNESNTLLLDDSPYKALRNPPYTAIFPYTYSYRNTKDTGLGPEGDLRNYLEKLAESENVQKFIEQNPFGQLPITYDNESWKFYHKIIGGPFPEPESGPFRYRKKLLIIEVTGVLVDVTVPHEGYRPDTILGPRAVYKRPYCDEFWQFCCDRFNVGVWTSMPRRNINQIIDFLMGESQNKLLFCWDRSDCTDTGFRTVEDINKTLFLKDIKKLWEKKDENLPWEIGDYNESNTLLIELAPHKALLNPPNTAIFPYPYRYWMKEDNFLGPKGDLRVYLEKLAACDNVQKFVEQNPFGQRPIREKNLSWGFYQRVIRSLKSRCRNKVTAAVSAAPTLLEPKSDDVTAAPTCLEPERNETNVSVLEMKTETANAAVPPTLLEAKTYDTTAPTCLEPETNVTTVSAAPALLEPETNTTVSADPILLEADTNVTTVSADPTLLEPEANIVSAAPTLLESETNIVSAAPTLLESETNIVSAAPTLLEPETNKTTVSATPTLLEPETNIVSAAPTLLESETNVTTVSAAPTLLEPETNVTTVSADPTLLEADTNITSVSAAPTLLESGTKTAAESNTNADLADPNLLETTDSTAETTSVEHVNDDDKS